MIKSMTGYGGCLAEVEAVKVSAEIKSVNNRFLDISVHLPRSCLFAEEPVRAAVAEHMTRGKADVFFTVDTSQAEQHVIRVNENLARGYWQAVQDTASRFGLPGEMRAMDLVRFPDVLSLQSEALDRDLLTRVILQALAGALEDFDAMRLREGEKLRENLEQKLLSLESLLARVEERSPQTVAEYREKLLIRLQEVLKDAALDENRILQEAALFADKVAVDEEMVRLRSHISQFRRLLANGSPAGRTLDFLVQEMNREVNTTGSKCVDSEIASVVIDMKAELEKIREQIQNLE